MPAATFSDSKVLKKDPACAIFFKSMGLNDIIISSYQIVGAFRGPMDAIFVFQLNMTK